MHVSIRLDTPHATWTNLDRICGAVILQTNAATPIISIAVKLEGESRTRLRAPMRALPGPVDHSYDDWGGEKLLTREERHKLLYRTAVVFPPQTSMSPAVRYHTLPAGQFEFPFDFKFPFNNACEDFGTSTVTNLTQMARVGVKGATAPVSHTKRTLPPTLTTFPGMAEVGYYVKVTVNRKEFYKENPRSVQYLNFLPIEPPRQTPTGSETFARRQHQFQPVDPARSMMKKSFFGSNRFSDADIVGNAPLVRVDVRLPSPPILTCNESVPMRIILQRLNESTEQLFLQSLHVVLHATTHFRANEITRDDSTNWVILSTSNMRLPLRSDGSKQAVEDGEEMLIDSALWRDRVLPSSVAPTFETCNIRRDYDLEIVVGLSYRNDEGSNVGCCWRANQTATIPLRHKVKVFSGIRPPAALVASMAGRAPPVRKPVQSTTRPEKSPAATAPLHLRTNLSIIPSTSQPGPSTPVVATPSSHSAQHNTYSVPSPQYAPLPPGEEEPPPSYEDAIVSHLPPLTGPRAQYEQPPRLGAAGGFVDAKGRDRDD